MIEKSGIIKKTIDNYGTGLKLDVVMHIKPQPSEKPGVH